MKKRLSVLCILLCISLLPINVTASTSQEEKANELQETRNREIMELYDKRQDILLSTPVDIIELNEIDIKLNNLGIEFLTTQEVIEQFPETIVANSEQEAENSYIGEDNIANPMVDAMESNINSWSTHRYPYYLYNGVYYDVQILIAQPTSEESPLWDEGARTVNYDVNWTAGTTNFLQYVATSTLSTLAPISMTVYEAFETVWSGLQPTSEIEPAEVIYRWENVTTAMFAYVRLAGTSDDTQVLSQISTKCNTEVAYIADIAAWKENGAGENIVAPGMKTDSRNFYSTPNNYGSVTDMISAYINYHAGPTHNAIEYIVISDSECETIQTISPCYPQFPIHCEM